MRRDECAAEVVRPMHVGTTNKIVTIDPKRRHWLGISPWLPHNVNHVYMGARDTLQGTARTRPSTGFEKGRHSLKYGPMIYLDMKRTTIFLGDADREAIRTIQKRFGVSTDSDAIRLALRILAQTRQVALDPLPDAVTEGEKHE